MAAATLWAGSNRSRSGAVHNLRTQSKPSAHFGWVESLSLWRGVHFESKVNPLQTLGGSNRSRCGAVCLLRAQVNPLRTFGWVKSHSLGASFETRQVARSVARCVSQQCHSAVLIRIRSLDQKCCSDVSLKNVSTHTSAA